MKDVKAFLSNFTEENVIELSGRIPGYKNDDKNFLVHLKVKPIFGEFMQRVVNVQIKYQSDIQNL